MKYPKMFLATALAVGTSIAGTAMAGPNLLTNGGFESGDFSGWTVAIDPAFSGVDHPAAHSGGYGAYFGDFGTPGAVSQSFATIAGTGYTIDLWLRSDGLVPNSFQVLWGGTPVYTATNVGSFAYTEILIDRLATSALTTLELRVRNDNGFLELDDVSVSAVPEPSSLALLGIGVFVLAELRRRKS